MPAIIALAIRALIQMAVTLGLITLAEKYVLPLINRGIAAIIEVFGVSEEDAKDIMANEILIFAESVGIGVLLLRTKIPTSIAEKLGFTSKGWNKRPLTGKAATVRSGTTASGIIVPGGLLVPAATEISTILTTAKSSLPGFATAFNFLAKTLGLTFLGFIAFNNLIDFGNWNSGAYQKTFQKIFAKVTFGLLVPDEDYRKTKTVSPEVFDKVYNTYKLEGAVGINDPFKKQTILFSRDNLIDLIDKVGAELLRTTQRASTKDVLLATQLFMVFSESAEAPAATIAMAKAATLPQIKVFTGVLTQGKLGEAAPFIARETDLISSIENLQRAAENNLASFIMALPGKIVYEIKIVSSITTKDGFIQRGTIQRIISGYFKSGNPKYKTVVNKFAQLNIYVFTSRKVRTKIDTIVLGPVDSVAFQPKSNEIQLAEQTIKANITTADVNEIKTIITDQPPQVAAPTAFVPGPSGPTVFVNPGAIAFAERMGFNNFSAEGESYTKENGFWYRDRDHILAVTTPPLMVAAPAIITPAPVTAGPSVAIPSSNNPNKCFVSTIAEFFDINKINYPKLKARAPLYEAWGLGPAAWYTGTAEQNNKLLTEFKRRSGC